MVMRVIVLDMDGVLVDIDGSWKFVHQRFGKTNQDNLEKEGGCGRYLQSSMHKPLSSVFLTLSSALLTFTIHLNTLHGCEVFETSFYKFASFL